MRKRLSLAIISLALVVVAPSPNATSLAGIGARLDSEARVPEPSSMLSFCPTPIAVTVRQVTYLTPEQGSPRVGTAWEVNLPPCTVVKSFEIKAVLTLNSGKEISQTKTVDGNVRSTILTFEGVSTTASVIPARYQVTIKAAGETTFSSRSN